MSQQLCGQSTGIRHGDGDLVVTEHFSLLQVCQKELSDMLYVGHSAQLYNSVLKSLLMTGVQGSAATVTVHCMKVLLKTAATDEFKNILMLNVIDLMWIYTV